jgi:hypothetical protein
MASHPKESPMSIVGKFFCFCGEEYLHTGEIVEQLDAATVLVRFDKCKHVPVASAVAMAMSSMVSKMGKDGELDPTWEFFDTRADLDAWMTWLGMPDDDRHKDAGEEVPKLN